MNHGTNLPVIYETSENDSLDLSCDLSNIEPNNSFYSQHSSTTLIKKAIHRNISNSIKSQPKQSRFCKEANESKNFDNVENDQVS